MEQTNKKKLLNNKCKKIETNKDIHLEMKKKDPKH